jgi:hypothetical protein
MDLKPFPRIGTVRAKTNGGTVPRPLPMVSNLGSKRNSRKARKRKGLLSFDNNKEGVTSFVEKAVAKLDTCFFGCNRSGTPLKTSFRVVVVDKTRGESFWESICRTILDMVSYLYLSIDKSFSDPQRNSTNQLRSDESNVMRGFVMNMSTQVSTPSKLKQTRLERRWFLSVKTSKYRYVRTLED